MGLMLVASSQTLNQNFGGPQATMWQPLVGPHVSPSLATNPTNQNCQIAPNENVPISTT